MSDVGISAGFQAGATLAVALDVLLKTSALLALAYAIHAALGRGRPLVRSAFWNGCLVGLILLPGASLAFPRLRVAIPSGPASPLPRAVPSIGLDSVEAPRPTGPRFEIPAEAPGLPTVGGSGVASLPRPGRPAPVARSRPVARWDWGVAALGVYLAGVLVAGLRLVGSMVAVGRLVAGSWAVDDPRWVGPLAGWRGRLGVARGVEIRASGAVSVPIAVGWLRPSIVVPAGLVGSAGTGVIDSVLLHELGHVRRGDFGWNLARKVVEVAYWPHPLVWPIARVVGPVREQACDDLCVHALGGPVGYSASLLSVASRLVRRPDASLGLAMARPSNLARRLTWIAGSAGAPRCLLRWPARLAVAAGVAAFAGVLGSVEVARSTAKARPVEAKQEPKPKAEEIPPKADPDGPEVVVVTVKAKDTGRPLAGAKVQAYLNFQFEDLFTDAEGRVRIDRAGRTFNDSLNIDIDASGYVQQRFAFARRGRLPKIPAELTVELNPGEETLGGKVVDEEGKPIAGVGVKVWGYLGSKKESHELAFMVEARTDARGEWRCRSFRAMRFAFLYLSHPDYLADTSMTPRRHGKPQASSQDQPGDRPMGVLRDFSDVQTLTKGDVLAGVVLDEQGKPVAGAEVGWLTEQAMQSTFHNHLPVTTSGADGRFRFGHVAEGRLMVQAKASGHAPGLSWAEAGRGAEPVEVRVGPPRTLAGRVVDSKGVGVAGASVNVDAWRGSRALGVLIKTDAEGRFRWTEAPGDSLLIGVGCSGFMSISQQRVVPDEREIPFTLRRSLSISGTVRDASTKKVIDDSTVEVGRPNPKTGEMVWREGSVFAMQGTLQANLDAEDAAEYSLRIRARGYETQVTRAFRADEGEVEYDVALKPTGQPQVVPLNGTVRRLDGSPLAGVDVAVTYPRVPRRRDLRAVSISDGKIVPDRDQPVAKTGPDGRFTIGREADPDGRSFAVIVAHPDGFAEVDRASFEANPNIVLRPWARVEGVVKLGGRPAPGAVVAAYADRLGNADVPSISDRSNAPTDGEGRFVFARVVPGDVRLGAKPGAGDKSQAWLNGTVVRLSPGEVAHVELGGRGRPVVARIARPAGFDPKADYKVHSEFGFESDRPRIPYPDGMLQKADGSAVTWAKQWWASAEGLAYRQARFGVAQVKLQPDGTIRVEDVPPGDYELTLTYSAERIYGPGASPERIARVTKKFTIPPIPEGRSDEPFDLGTLEPVPLK